MELTRAIIMRHVEKTDDLVAVDDGDDDDYDVVSSPVVVGNVVDEEGVVEEGGDAFGKVKAFGKMIFGKTKSQY